MPSWCQSQAKRHNQRHSDAERPSRQGRRAYPGTNLSAGNRTIAVDTSGMKGLQVTGHSFNVSAEQHRSEQRASQALSLTQGLHAQPLRYNYLPGRKLLVECVHKADAVLEAVRDRSYDRRNQDSRRDIRSLARPRLLHEALAQLRRGGRGIIRTPGARDHLTRPTITHRPMKPICTRQPRLWSKPPV